MPTSKRPPTSGTRKGNGSGAGPGWGGPATGAGKNRATQPDFEPGNNAAAGYHNMTRSERLAALDERKWLIGMGLVQDAQPVQVAAINSYEDRHQGKARQSVELSGAEGAPMAFVVYGQKEAANTDEWTLANPPPK